MRLTTTPMQIIIVSMHIYHIFQCAYFNIIILSLTNPKSIFTIQFFYRSFKLYTFSARPIHHNLRKNKDQRRGSDLMDDVPSSEFASSGSRRRWPLRVHDRFLWLCSNMRFRIVLTLFSRPPIVRAQTHLRPFAFTSHCVLRFVKAALHTEAAVSCRLNLLGPNVNCNVRYVHWDYVQYIDFVAFFCRYFRFFFIGTFCKL